MPDGRNKPVDPGGSRLDAFAKARCRCGSEVWFERKHVNKVQTCQKCDVEFHVKIVRDNRGNEQVIASFPTKARAASAPEKKKGGTTLRRKIKNVRDIDAPPITIARPREPSRDGKFVIDMTTDKSHREPPPAEFEEAKFGAPQMGVERPGQKDPFEAATFSSREIVQPYTSRRETIPGVMYTTCPCGEPSLVKREDLGGKVRCPACRRDLFVDAQRDPQTREIVIRLKPIDTKKSK